jgi:DNA replication protein DnaC
LRLSGLLNSLELRLQEAEANRLPYAEFLELLFQDEINVRHQRLLARRHKSADFREPRSLENFDFNFNPTINRTQIYELAAAGAILDRLLHHAELIAITGRSYRLQLNAKHSTTKPQRSST